MWQVPDTEGIDVPYLKNVLVAFLEVPLCEPDKRARLRPVLTMLLKLSEEENSRLDSIINTQTPTTGWLW